MDILGSLVKTVYGEESVSSRKPSTDRAEKGDVRNPVLSDADFLRNAFVMILTGHETAANSVHFSLIELACSPRSQRLVQKEV